MPSFEELKKSLQPEITELKAALAVKKRSNDDIALTQKYLGLQFQLDQKLRKRGLKGAELDVALKAIMEIVQSA